MAKYVLTAQELVAAKMKNEERRTRERLTEVKRGVTAQHYSHPHPQAQTLLFEKNGDPKESLVYIQIA